MVKERVIWVTGALAGIRRATALAAARKGYRAVVVGRNPKTGEALASERRALGTEALFVAADLHTQSEM
jgi:NAD(P)-dependent dehydrogenase (short-subunit alcohol dehydrogenase family)